MLRGNYLATVDEKGRVKIPSDFLAQMQKGENRTAKRSDHRPAECGSSISFLGSANTHEHR